MKTISIPVTDEQHESYVKKEGQVNKVLQRALKAELATDAQVRMEYVKVICRAKAPVCNWHDMEIQILKGSL